MSRTPDSKDFREDQSVELESSALRSASYDENARTLDLEFTSGTVYRYFSVPKQVYDELLAAESKGTYFVERIRPAGFRFERIRG